MALIPVLELGLWNSWILVVLMFVFVIGFSALLVRLLLGSERSQEINKRHGSNPELNKKEKKLDKLSTVILLAMFAYSIFLPLELGTIWFYFGIIIYAMSIFFGFTAMINFALAPLDKPVTKGAYSISRNPMYFSMFLAFVGISIVCASWLFLVLNIFWIILVDRIVVAEERLCVEMYGDSYRGYMDRTSRWIGIPKSKEKK